jgi:hypothetical protein
MNAILKGQKHTVDKVFALALFCAFAASVLLVLIIGAGVYKNTVKSMEDRYTERTCLSYVSSKVHHYDAFGGVHLQQFGDGQALALEEKIGGSDFVTLIYTYKGYVMELFMEKGTQLTPADGEVIIKDIGLEFQQAADNLINVSCTNENGRSDSMYININSYR